MKFSSGPGSDIEAGGCSSVASADIGEVGTSSFSSSSVDHVDTCCKKKQQQYPDDEDNTSTTEDEDVSFSSYSEDDDGDEMSPSSSSNNRIRRTSICCWSLVLASILIATALLGALLFKNQSLCGTQTGDKHTLGSNDADGSSSLHRMQVSFQDSSHQDTVLRKVKECAQEIIDHRGNELIIMATQSCIDMLKNQEELEAPDDAETKNFLKIEEDYPVQALSLGSSFSDPLPQTETAESFLSRNAMEIVPWGIEMIQADQVDMGSENITVCLADTGISIDHPDFISHHITGEDYFQWATDSFWKWDADVNGHGTHLAGIVAAWASNGIGVAGAGPIHLHIVRALNDEARGYESDMRRSIQSCIDAEANIISLSLGTYSLSDMTSELIDHAVDDLGIMIVAATGNSGTELKLYPAAHPKVIAVGAVKEDGLRWAGSTYGNHTELMAPGVKVLSTAISPSSVSTRVFQHHAEHLAGSSHESIMGTLKDCGNGSERCNRNRNGVCLIKLESANFLDTVLRNCERSRAKGAILYHAAGGNNFDSWSHSTELTVVIVSRLIGEELVQHEREQVTIGDSGDDGIEYTYREMTGTSMAAPHVAAAAALVWSHFGGCSVHQIRYALVYTAFHPNGGCDEYYGNGIVKARDAYRFLARNDCADWSVPEPASIGGCTTAALPIVPIPP
jgi:subtilisin family serine protease